MTNKAISSLASTVLAALLAALLSPAQAGGASLISNGDFATDANGDSWPDGWPKLSRGGTWKNEDGLQYLRLESSFPGENVMLYREIPIPAGVEALKLTFRARCSNLVPGTKPWFDSRIIMDFKNAAGEKLPAKVQTPFFRKSTSGWVEKSISFLVPTGAATLDFMPALFEVKSGTFDIDDITLEPVAPATVMAEVKAREKANWKPAEPPVEAAKPELWPKEIRVVGNRLQDPDGNEVWLQGVHVVSLEWTPKGESVLASMKTAIESWKANVIRLSVTDGYWNSENGKSYQDLIDAAVNLAANRGAYIVIDNHRYRAVRPEHLTFWTEVASKYKNHPAVLFDIINEPHTITWDVWKHGGFVEEKKKKADEDAFLSDDQKEKNKQGFHSPGMQKLVDTIRATGAKNIIVAGGLDWAYDLSGVVNGYALEDNSGNGIMYSTHIYNWKKNWEDKVLRAAAKYPILVGEVGADIKKMNFIPAEAQEDPYTWVPDMLGLIQKHKLNWTGFSFHPSATPVLISDWRFTPTPFWGEYAKKALAGEQFQVKKLR